MLRVGSVRLAFRKPATSCARSRANLRRMKQQQKETTKHHRLPFGGRGAYGMLLQGMTDRSETLMSQKPAITRGNIHKHWESWSVLASSSPGGPVKSTTGARH